MVSRCSRGSNLINSSFNINYYSCTCSVFSYTLQYSQHVSHTIYQRPQSILWLASFDTGVNTIKSQPSKLANSVLQFIFNGYTGFTFPAAHYPVKVMSAEELNHLAQRLIHSLEKHGFNVSGIAQLSSASWLNKICSTSQTHMELVSFLSQTLICKTTTSTQNSEAVMNVTEVAGCNYDLSIHM